MRWRFPGARLCAGVEGLILAVLVVGLASCDQAKLTLYPTPPPKPADVVHEFNDFNNAWNGINATSSDEAAVAYVSMGYLVADRACGNFFTNLRKLRNDTSLAKDVTRDIAASAGLIASLTTVPTSVLTGLFGATGAFPQVVDDFQKTFLFAEAGDSLYPLVSSMMASYRLNFPAVDHDVVVTDASGKQITLRGATRLNANLRVRQHAVLCSVPFLSYILKTGVIEITKDTSTDTAKGAATAGAAAGAAAAAGMSPSAAVAAGVAAATATGVPATPATTTAASAGAKAGASAPTTTAGAVAGAQAGAATAGVAAPSAAAPLASGGAVTAAPLKIGGQSVGAK